jgi:ferredoxin-NADP reductase
VGDALDVSSPRGSFVLQSGERPVVLLSAGIRATPVLAMLHALAAARSTRQVLWLHGARDRQHHPFAAEVRRLMLALTRGRGYVCYSRPGSRDKMGEDFDAAGHLSQSVLDTRRDTGTASSERDGNERAPLPVQAGQHRAGVLHVRHVGPVGE